MLDINDVILEQLERLNDPDLKGEKLQEELQKTDGMSKLVKVYIDNKEADTKREELGVKKDLIKYQYGKGGNLPALPGGLANEENIY